MVAAAEQGLAALPNGRSPRRSTTNRSPATKQQMRRGSSTARWATSALQAKDYDKARHYFGEAVAAEPANLQDVYQLAVSQLEGSPLDALGFWYAARSIAIARAARNETAATDIDRYVRSRYRLYRGNEEGWKETAGAGRRRRAAPPANFVEVDPAGADAAEAAVVLVEENDPAALSFADWALVLRHRDASPANKAAAEKVWAGDLDKQQRRRHPAQDPGQGDRRHARRHRGGDHREAQAANSADLHIAMAHPLAPLPAVGSRISIIGTLSDYRPQPFKFVMTQAELAPRIAAGGRRPVRRPAAPDVHARIPAGLRPASRRQPQDLRQCLHRLQRSRGREPGGRRLPLENPGPGGLPRRRSAI